MTSKQDIRRHIREIFRSMTADQVAAESQAVCEHILSRVHAEGRQGMTILLYWPMPDEVQTDGIIDILCNEGNTILLPVVVGEDVILKEYHGRDSLRSGAFGIPEPTGAVFSEMRYGNISIAFIPGRAFSSDGRRLGRGKGYYDRLLPAISCPKIGVCFQFQIDGNIPAEPHDILMDEVIF